VPVGSECVLLERMICLSSGWVYAIKDLAYFLLYCLIYILPEILQTIRSTWGNFYDHIARYVLSGLCNLTASKCSLPSISGEKNNCSVIFLSHLVVVQPCCRQALPVFYIDWTLASRRCSLRSFSYFYRYIGFMYIFHRDMLTVLPRQAVPSIVGNMKCRLIGGFPIEMLLDQDSYITNPNAFYM